MVFRQSESCGDSRMGVLNKQERLKALYKQEFLNRIHCKYFENGNERNSPELCDGCAIYDELSGIGEVLTWTVRERNKKGRS